MKMEEAANLCLVAAVLNEGDVHVIDMGEPIKILDVINKLMEILENSSEIQIVGLRKGEKLKEQLWSSQEIVCPTKMKEVKALNLVVSRLPLHEFTQQPGSNERAIAEIDRFLKGCNVGM
jgi:FlaA1/EpsC-like NDP-sugar epimerase